MGTPLLSAIVLAAATASPAPAPAADPCAGASGLLATLNRPTIGFSSCAVKVHESVWELGYANQPQSGGSRIVAYPQGFIRFGASPNVEVDLIGPAYQIQQIGGATLRGFSDSGVGAKYEYFHDAANVAALDFLYLAPTGAPAFTAGAPIATLNFDYGRSISPASGFSTTLGVQSSFAADRNGRAARFASLLPSLVFTTQPNPRAQFYLEAYCQMRLRPDGGMLFGLDGGLQYLATPSLELDAELGQTVTDLIRAHYFGVGLGVRL